MNVANMKKARNSNGECEGARYSDDPVTIKSQVTRSEKTVFDLPDELLCFIFSHLRLEDLVLSVRHVCRRWSVVVEDNSIWRSLQYQPPPGATEEEVMVVLKASPKLQWPLAGPWVTFRILKTLGEYCPDLRRLFFLGYDCNYENLQILENVVRICRNIEYIHVGDMRYYVTECLLIFGLCRNLKVLFLKGATRERGIFVAIAEGCPKLESLDVRYFYHDLQDLTVLLERRRDKMLSLAFSCCEGYVMCVFPVVAQHCTKLQELVVDGYLHSGSIDCFVDYFRSEPAANLRKIELMNIKNCDRKLTAAIFQTCRNLMTLAIQRCCKLTDRCLEGVSRLRNLESLNLSGCKDITDVGVTHIAKCVKLKDLNLNHCAKLTDQAFVTCCVNLPNLCALSLNITKVTATSLEQVPTYLKKVRTLCISGYDLEETINALKSRLPDMTVYWNIEFHKK